MPDVKATGGIVEIPLAQTGEGIADCELIKWFVQEVPHTSSSTPVILLSLVPFLPIRNDIRLEDFRQSNRFIEICNYSRVALQHFCEWEQLV